MATSLPFRVWLSMGGDRVVVRRLLSLEGKTRGRILRGSFREAMRPLLSASKAEAPTRRSKRGKRLKSGNLKRALVLRKSKWAKGKRGLVGFEVSIGRKHKSFEGKDGTGKRRFYASFVETGHRIKAGGRSRGRVKGTPYLRRPFRRLRRSIEADAMRRILVEIKALSRGG